MELVKIVQTIQEHKEMENSVKKIDAPTNKLYNLMGNAKHALRIANLLTIKDNAFQTFVKTNKYYCQVEDVKHVQSTLH